ncbi:MAG: hypothetical protein ABL967_18925 [Bryobacteraceae bacterium]
MRRIAFVFLAGSVLFAGHTFGQAMTEFGAAAAGGSIGAAGGKSLSNGLNNIFGRMGQTMEKAAGTGDPAMTVAPGKLKETGGVPAPPSAVGSVPVSNAPVRRAPDPSALAVQIPFQTGVLSDALPSQPPPAPPAMTRDDLRNVANGMNRSDVLKLGAPSSKMTTFENGHLVESYSYRENGSRFGGVKLTDGVVSDVQVQ